MPGGEPSADGFSRRPKPVHQSIAAVLLPRASLVRLAPVLLHHRIEQHSALVGAYGLDGYLRNSREQLGDFLGIGDFGVIVFGVGVNQGKHGKAPPRQPRDQFEAIPVTE
jgi:hypothetical protein